MRAARYFSAMIVTLGFCQTSLADTSLEGKILELERKMGDLQFQIKELKTDLGQDVSDADAQRISNLESYAVELHDVLENLSAQVDENSNEVARVARAQENQPKLGIYGSFLASKQEGENSVFDGQSFEFILSGQPHKRLSYFTELEFERAATVGGERGGEVLLEQAYTDLALTSNINFRGGVLLVPFGNIERDHYAPLREVISKPYTAYALAPSDWTDNGLGFNGKLDLAGNWLLDYQAYFIAGLDHEISTVGLRDARQGFGVDNNDNKGFATKLNLHNTSGLSLGLSFYNGGWDNQGNRDITGLNLDADYRWESFEVMGEVTRMEVERPTGSSAIMDGYYLRGIWSIEGLLPPNWLGADFPEAKLSLVAQFDEVVIENFFDPTTADNSEQRLTLGLRLQPVKSWVVNLNYEHGKADGPTIIDLGDNDRYQMSLGYVF